MKKRLLALFMATMMFISILPTQAFAAEGDIVYNDAKEALDATGVTASKTITRNEDGTYKITLSVTGTSETSSSTQELPADIVLVLDTSGSMDEMVYDQIACTGTIVRRTGGMGGNRVYYQCNTCYRNSTAEYENEACPNTIEDRSNPLGTRLSLAQSAANAFVTGLLAEEGIKIGLADFSGSNAIYNGGYDDHQLVDLTNNASALTAAINALTYDHSDGTNYAAGLRAAERILDAGTNDNQFVVFISDGDPNSNYNVSQYRSDAAGTTAADALERKGVTIFSVGIDLDDDSYLEAVSSEDEDGNEYCYLGSAAVLEDILAQLSKTIQETIHAGKNGVMVDLVNTDAFQLVPGSADSDLEINNSGNTLTWDIGDITQDTQSVTFDVALKEGYVAEGEVLTNTGVTLTFDSTALDGKTVTLTTPAIGSPAIYGMVINGNTVTKPYNGEKQSVENTDFTWEYLPEGFDVTNVTIAVEGEGINAGEYPTKVNIDNFIVKDAEDNDITDLCVVTQKNDGKLIIEPQPVTLKSQNATKTYDGTPLTNDTVKVESGTFYGNDGFTATVTGSQTVVGSSDNTFTYALNEGTIAENYDIETEFGTLAVTDRNQDDRFEIAVTANSDEFIYDGTEQTVSGLKQTEFEVNGQIFTVSGLTASAAETNAGTYTVTVEGTAVVTDALDNDVTGQFTVSKHNGTLSIKPRAVTLTSETATKEYDGKELVKPVVTVSGDGFVEGEVSNIKAIGSVTYPNENATNIITYTAEKGFIEDNYVITKNEGTLSITSRKAKYQVSVKANSDEHTYDGTAKSVEGFETLTVIADNGMTYTVSGLSAFASGTDAKTYTTQISGKAVVKDAAGRDVTSEFDVTAVPGELKINKRQVTMTSATDEKEYDGEPLTNDEIRITGDGWADGEGAEYDVTGTRTLVGSAANAFTYELKEGTKAANYEISKVEGTLTVTNRETPYAITVVANSDGFLYDGSEKTVEGFETLTFTVDGNEYTVEGLTASVTATNAGEYDVNVVGTPVVKDADNNDVTAQFAVSVEAGLMTIAKREVTLTSATDSKQYDGKPLTNDQVTVSGDGFARGEGAEYTVTGSQKLPGTTPNAFTYALNEGTSADNYEITKVEGTLEVTNREKLFEITVEANSGSKLYDGESITVTGFKSLEFSFDGVPFTVEGLSASVTETDAGTYTNKVSGTAVVKDADDNDVTKQFIVKTVDGKLEISKRQVTLTSATANKQYDGKALTNDEVTVTGDGWAAGEGAKYDVTGTQTLVGSSSNAFTYTLNRGTNADNYEITKVEGTLTVMNREAKYEITVEANSDVAKYDGSEKSVSGFKTLTFEIEGNTYTVSGLTASAEGTDAGTYPATVTGTAVVKDASGADVTAQFAVKTVNGQLIINKRDVILTSATDEKEYDGHALTNDEVTVSGDGFAEGEGATYSVTGSQKLVGSSENTFTYALKEDTKADNYNITTNNGTLTVVNRNAKFEITVVANSDEFQYDGTEKTVSGFETLTFTVNKAEFTVSDLTAETTKTDAGEYRVNVVGTPVVKDADGNDVSAQFAVHTEHGTLTITKRAITLTSATDSKQYDGKPLTNEQVTVSGDGFARGEGASYIVSGSQTLVGSSNNTFTYTLNEGTKAANYEITKTEGTLTVTNREKKFEITVEANSGSKLYDGESITVSGFKTLEFSFDGVPFTVEGLSASVTETNAGIYTNEIIGTAIVKDVNGNDVTKQFIVKTVDGKLEISKRQVTLTSATDSKQYDGKALTNKTVTVTGDGWATGEGATYKVTGTQTLVGSSSNAFTYTLNNGTKADNYSITQVPGTLTVANRDAKYEITVVANSGKYKYDGSKKTVSGFETLTFEVEGNTYTVSGLTASAEGTDAGTYPATVTGTAVVKDASGADVTAQFTVKTVNGLLTVTKRDVTLTSATDEKEYDGYALTNDEVTVSGDGFARGEGAAYTVTGSQTLVGSSENTFSYELNEGTKADNYNITTNNGTLTVVNRNAKYEITVVANSGEYKYDGTAKTASGFETLAFTINGLKFTVSDLTAETTQTDAGEYPVNVVGTPVVKDAKGNNVTAQFAVYTKNGQLTITKRSVTMTSATAAKEYDGKALTDDTVTVSGDGFASGEGAAYTVTGSQTLVGSSANTFTYTLNEGTKAANYDITKTEGTLTVKDRSNKYELIVEANSAEYAYDGSEKSVEGFKTLTFTVDGNKYTVEGLTASVTATEPGVYTATVTGTAVVRDSKNNDVTTQFTVKTVNGQLAINPLVTVEYYLEDLDLATTETASVNNGQDNPFVVKYGEGFSIVIGEGEGTYTAPTAITSEGLSYVFDSAVEALSADSVTGNVTVKLYYAVDTWNDEEDNDTPDGIADKYQAKVTYKIVNGTWDGTDTADKTEVFTIKTKSAVTGEWTAISVTLAGTIPTGMQPDATHVIPGAWDVLITDETPVTESVTYTYTYPTEKVLGLDVEKMVDKTKVKVGDTIVYTITVENIGNVALTDVTVTDTFSGKIAKIKLSGELADGVTYTGNGVFTIDKLDVAETVTISFSYKTATSDKGTLTNTVVTEATPEDGSDPVQDEDTADNVVVTKPGGSITPTGPELNREDHFAYIVGLPDGLVHPEKNITRAEVATIFFRMLLDESREDFWSQENWFPDVTSDMWCNNAISTLTNAGLFTGYPDGTFGPNNNITRAEFATIAIRFFLEDDVEITENNLSDVKGHWAEANINLAHALNLITGYPDGTFKPDQLITRAEAMTIVNRVLKRAPHEDHLLDDMIVWPDNMDKSAWYYEAVQEATNSHEFTMTKSGYEIWTELLPVRDWVALEQEWSSANSAKNPGEVVDIIVKTEIKD